MIKYVCLALEKRISYSVNYIDIKHLRKQMLFLFGAQL